jgi:uncharacterized protein YuzE
MAEYTYDAEARSAYLRLSDDAVAETVDLMSGVYVDVDDAGSVVGIELVGCPAEVPQALVNSIDETLRRQGFTVGGSWTPLTARFASADRPLSTT